MNAALVALALLGASAGIAAADGWIDCHGPDKSGHGRSASRDSASTGAVLALVGAVAYVIGRHRRGPR